MKYLLTAALVLFLLPACLAQQNNPIIVEGRYAAGADSAAGDSALKKEINDSLAKMSDALSVADYNFVITTSESLLRRGISDPRVYTAAALAYEAQGKYDSARYNASQAISLQPSNVEAYTTRANAFYNMGDIFKAREDIETALKLNPKSSRAQKIKEIILADASSIKKTEQQQRMRKKNVKKDLPPWFYVYVGCVVLVVLVFLAFRYRGLAGVVVDEHGRRMKEVNIKEQYQFIRPIGEGGMGKVYEAYDNVLKRKVAVKRIKPELLKSAYVREQFLSEARMVAMLHHPCIVEIYTVIETANSLYLVFEYVEGQTLETRLDIDNSLTFKEAKEIFGSVCKGLSYAHSNNIVHCDLKPGNIMISDSGIAKVMDFGVAKKLVEGESSGARTVAGTPAYMSPEQQKGFMTRQSDIYSLGVCLYEALIGQVPWSVQGFDINTKKIVPPSSLVPGIPPAVDDLIEKSLNDDPAKRMQTVDEFWNALKNA